MPSELVLEPEEGFEPSTFRLRDGCSASIWSALDRSGLLTSDASSIQTDPDRSRRIVWMIKRMIKCGTGRAPPGACRAQRLGGVREARVLM